MTPRLTLAVVFTLSLIGGVAAKEKSQPKAPGPTRTWKFMTDYVLKNGGDDSIEAPASRTLGYDSDKVPAQSLGLDQPKSKDDHEHNIFVVYDRNAKGVMTPKEIVLGFLRVTDNKAAKSIDSYRLRVSLEGKLIGGMHAYGVAGEVVQKTISAKSNELISLFKKESDFHLKEVDLAQLTK